MEAYARGEKEITLSTEWEGVQKWLQKKMEEIPRIQHGMGARQGLEWG